MTSGKPFFSHLNQVALVLLFSAGFFEVELISLGPLTLSSTETIMLAFIVAVALACLGAGRAWRWGGAVTVGLCLVAVSSLISALFCEHYVVLAFKYTLRFIFAIALYLALVNALSKSTDRRLALKTLALVTAFLALLAIIEHYAFDLIEPLVNPFRSNIFIGIPPPAFFSSGVLIEGDNYIIRSSSVFLHANILGYFLAMTAMLMIASLKKNASLRQTLFAVSCLLLYWYALTLTYSRGAFLALAIPLIGLVLFALLYLPEIRQAVFGRYLRLTLIGAALAVLVLLVNQSFIRGIEAILPGNLTREVVERVAGTRIDQPAQGSESRQEAYTSRMALWKAAVRMWKQNPLLGVGPDNFRMLYYEYLDQVDDDLSINKGIHRAHNLALNVLAEQGLVGLAALLFLLGAVLRNVWRGLKLQGATKETLGLAGAFGAFLIGNLFDTIFYYHIYMILVMTIFASWTVLADRGEG